MEALTLKENWKTPFVSASFRSMLWQSIRKALSFGVVVGIILGILQFFSPDMGFKEAAIMFVVCVIGMPIFFAAMLVMLFPFLHLPTFLFSLGKMIAPRTYAIGLEEDRFTIAKNGRPIVDIPLADYRRNTFVPLSVQGIDGNPLGNSFDLDYLENGNWKHKEINITYFLDEDKIRLIDFMERVDSQFKRLPQNNN
jgi:hypothetical protein